MPTTLSTHRGERCTPPGHPGPDLRRPLRGTVVLLVLSLAACVAPAPRGASDPVAAPYATRAGACPQPDAQTLAAVVRVSTDKGAHGSGVVIGHGRVLTAAHVVIDAEDTRVGLGDLHAAARVLALDEALDLALLAADTGSLRALPLSRRPLAAQEDVWAIGYPLAMHQVATHGQFEHAANGKLYTTAWITAGNSGGGLLQCTGGRYELAGILRDYIAYLREGVYVNAERSTSVPATAIRDFIARGADGGTL